MTAPFHEESWIESAAAGARNPHNWLATGESLKRASDLLRETWIQEAREMRGRFAEDTSGARDRPWEPWVGAPAMTLAAFAVENVLKGLMIARNQNLIQPRIDRPEELLDRKLKTHSLADLASFANVEPSADEEALLGRLTEFVLWAGRYPFPLRALETAPRPGAETGGSSFTSDWFPTLDALFSRLRDELFELGRQLDAAREQEAANTQQAKRPELLRRLKDLRRVDLGDGVTVFETDQQEKPGTQLACAACGMSVALSERRPAAICRCGTLYFGEEKAVAGRTQFAVDSFPPAPT